MATPSIRKPLAMAMIIMLAAATATATAFGGKYRDDDHDDDVLEEAFESGVKTGVDDARHKEAKDQSSDSWTGWAKDKLTEGLGLKSTHYDGGDTYHAAKNTKDKISDSASGK